MLVSCIGRSFVLEKQTPKKFCFSMRFELLFFQQNFSGPIEIPSKYEKSSFTVSNQEILVAISYPNCYHYFSVITGATDGIGKALAFEVKFMFSTLLSFMLIFVTVSFKQRLAVTKR